MERNTIKSDTETKVFWAVNDICLFSQKALCYITATSNIFRALPVAVRAVKLSLHVNEITIHICNSVYTGSSVLV